MCSHLHVVSVLAHAPGLSKEFLGEFEALVELSSDVMQVHQPVPPLHASELGS